MNNIFKLAVIPVLFCAVTIIMSLTIPIEKKQGIVSYKNNTPKIQVAILLDVSNSMDGLIEQAKAQLWNMVSIMGKAQCNNATPQIEIALYEYGRDNNSKADGYVKQINGFTKDLDQLSQNLFSLTTNGGSEYCGRVIYTSLKDLQWDASPENYKVIFIAGNEDFLQGDIQYSKACTEAKSKGVIVNTIYCGDSLQGIREHWNLAGDCGNGSFTCISQNTKIDDIATPYDSTIFVLNEKLNNTYVAYGKKGLIGAGSQVAADKKNYRMNKSVAIERTTVKSNAKLYTNTDWDLVDAEKEDKNFIDKLDTKDLPDSLKGKSREELKQIVKNKREERENIQKEIQTLSIQRRAHITSEKAKRANNTKTQTLGTAVENVIRAQVSQFNMTIE